MAVNGENSDVVLARVLEQLSQITASQTALQAELTRTQQIVQSQADAAARQKLEIERERALHEKDREDWRLALSSVRKPVDSTNKAVKMPANFVKKEQWDSFRFQVESYCSIVVFWT